MVSALAGQGSHMLGPFREMNSFIKLSEDSTGFNQGDKVIVRPLI
jgi:molybdopterin biosynthesis enzyme